MSADRPGRVVTFYSYKGGVGRTMALANVAWRLAHRHGLSVIVVDWDLEAPGLHRFLGFDTPELADKPGVLDFFRDWIDAVDEHRPDPPDAARWLVPITTGGALPSHGSLALLPAGRQDASYARKLAEFDWNRLYDESAGAAAVEVLREQLTNQADLVLVDSRTGLTDAGGICTVQLPDGVVLMSAPNEQSLEGTEGVADSIIRSVPEQRAGRPVPRLWLSFCRVPGSGGSAEWFRDHQDWFDRGVDRALWRREDHPTGLASLMLPQNERWGRGEPIIRHDRSPTFDPLGKGLDRLAATLFRWLFKGLLGPVTEQPISVEEATRRLGVAAARGDIVDEGIALNRLGDAQRHAGDNIRALESYGRAVGLGHALGDWLLQASALDGMSRALVAADRPNDAVVRLREALGLVPPSDSDAHSHAAWRADLATAMGRVLRSSPEHLEEALEAFIDAAAEARRAAEVGQLSAVLEDQLSVALALNNPAAAYGPFVELVSVRGAMAQDSDTALVIARMWLDREDYRDGLRTLLPELEKDSAAFKLVHGGLEQACNERDRPDDAQWFLALATNGEFPSEHGALESETVQEAVPEEAGAPQLDTAHTPAQQAPEPLVKNGEVMSTLILLVGSNPLPNYLAAATLQPDRVLLLHTPRTVEPAERIAEAIALHLGIAAIEQRLVTDGAIAQTVRDACRELPKGAHLNYTGGTKIMAAHARMAFRDQGGTDDRASYVDDGAGVLRFDDPHLAQRELSASGLDLKTLLKLHGLEAKPRGEPRGTDPNAEDAKALLDACLRNSDLATQLYRTFTDQQGRKKKPSEMKEHPFRPAEQSLELSQPIVPGGDWKTKQLEEWREFFRGGWLEIGVADQIRRLVPEAAIHVGVSAFRDGRPLEVDILVLRGHRLHMVSCTIDATLPLCKSKVFEAALRARQLGGDLARSALVCLLDGGNDDGPYADQLRTDVRNAWDAPNTPRLFARADLREWLGVDQTANTSSLKSWLDS